MPFAIVLLLFLTDKKVSCPRKLGFPGQLQVTREYRADDLVHSACLLDLLCSTQRPRTLIILPTPGKVWGVNIALLLCFCSSGKYLKFLWHLFVFNHVLEGILCTWNKQFHLEVKMNGGISMGSWTIYFFWVRSSDRDLILLRCCELPEYQIHLYSANRFWYSAILCYLVPLYSIICAYNIWLLLSQ